jgi:hypothetical protein
MNVRCDVDGKMLRTWLAAAPGSIRSEPEPEWDCDPRKRKGGKQRHRQQQPRRQQQQQQHQQPLKFNAEFSDAAQDAAYAELVGLKLDTPGATSAPAPKPWQRTNDPYLLEKRRRIGAANDLVLDQMRRKKAAAAAAESAALATTVPNGKTASVAEMDAFVRTLADSEARQSSVPAPHFVPEFLPPGREMSLPAYRAPPSQMDQFLAARAGHGQRQPQAQSPAQAELRAALKRPDFNARGLSQAAYQLYLAGMGIGG